MKSDFPKYVVIHGHFYQPPRENPWTETIERQPSASPYHDWNERIAWECYIPSGIARVVDSQLKIIDLVNNYAYISFNIGPTLLAWYERHHRREYERILRADERSRKRLGHGNAIAQAYSHRILPLAKRRDKVLQVLWGIADFKHRFGREPEAMWLPETACNLATLEVLADHALKYVILSPTQAERVRPFGSDSWIDVSHGTIDPRRPYRHFLSSDRNRFIDVFFYDDELARAVAFGHLMKDAKTAADRFEACFDPQAREPQIVHVATDGESYGHHERFADMTLAYLAKYEFPKRGLAVGNYGHYLERYSPNWEVEIKEGPEGEGTAWSCSHGLGRWKSECGCGRGGVQHQRWRAPLKKALDVLADELFFLYEEQGSVLFKDPEQALRQYIHTILDRRDNPMRRFLTDHLKGPVSEERIVAGLKLLEMQRHSQLMHTSCAWFFSEISGLETVQNLKYAARAIELAKEVSGRDLEKDFLARLGHAPSNIREVANGRNVYMKMVAPTVVTSDRILAHYALHLLFDPVPRESFLCDYRIERPLYEEKVTLTRKMAVGTVVVESEVTRERVEKLFFSVYVSWPRIVLRVYVKPDPKEGEFATLKEKIFAVHDETSVEALDQIGDDFFRNAPMGLKDLLLDEREKLVRRLLREKFDKLSQSYEHILREMLPMLEELHRLVEPVPDEIRVQIEFALREELSSWLARFGEDRDFRHLDERETLIAQAHKYGLSLATPQNEHLFETLMLREYWLLLQEWTLSRCRRVQKLVDFARAVGLTDWRYRMENQVFSSLVEQVYPRLGLASGEDREVLKAILEIAESLDINVSASLKMFEESKVAVT